MKTQDSTTPMPTGKIIQIDEARVRDHLAEIVRGSVEEALIEGREQDALDAEGRFQVGMLRLCGAA